jgi:hypothetical protein
MMENGMVFRTSRFLDLEVLSSAPNSQRPAFKIKWQGFYQTLSTRQPKRGRLQRFYLISVFPRAGIVREFEKPPLLIESVVGAPAQEKLQVSMEGCIPSSDSHPMLGGRRNSHLL